MCILYCGCGEWDLRPQYQREIVEQLQSQFKKQSMYSLAEDIAGTV